MLKCLRVLKIDKNKIQLYTEIVFFLQKIKLNKHKSRAVVII